MDADLAAAKERLEAKVAARVEAEIQERVKAEVEQYVAGPEFRAMVEDLKRKERERMLERVQSEVCVALLPCAHSLAPIHSPSPLLALIACCSLPATWHLQLEEEKNKLQNESKQRMRLEIEKAEQQERERRASEETERRREAELQASADAARLREVEIMSY